MTRTPEQIVDHVRRMVAGEQTHSQFADLFAEDGVMAYRFPTHFQPEEIKGREEIRAYFGQVRGAAVRDRIEIQSVEAQCWRTNDPSVAVAEITHRGWSKVKQDHYTFTAVAIIHLRDGEIVRYDDYMNPLLLTELLGV
ncbi:nuclear transport factor 2 family protein [Lentzea sp. BCCO 10_0061]|uniref:Nuclear transport factor 2 family protein n=1 Tax=Lentzea sokolovensis TaxID=3095429 RepID=A0ABU4UN93_9PSEU|nr:nuclear transport factor 2 family protein [Lentzea sp. BCCO 10_0061]MDX8140954.1 nuclear transport factor 2 family protein [Lentzea sp. BCCO 10_0061]